MRDIEEITRLIMDERYALPADPGIRAATTQMVREIAARAIELAGPDANIEPELAPANDLCGGCSGDRTGGRCSTGCGWGLSLLPEPTPVERGLLDVAGALGVDAGLGGWLGRTVAAAKATCRERDEERSLRRERQAQFTTALNALATIAADLRLDAGFVAADWVGEITKAIRDKASALRTAAAGLQDIQANAHAQQVALRDIGAALGVEGEPLSAVVTAAKAAMPRPSADVMRGLVALSSALTKPQAEHPDVRAACAWIAGGAGSEPPPVPLVVAERWVPYAGEIFEGRIRRAGILDDRWYLMEWRGWSTAPSGYRASVRLIDPGPLPGDTLEEMRPCRR